MSLGSLIKYERCEYWLYNCPFTNSTGDCVNHFCNGQPNGFGTCTEYFPTAGACCQKADPASCLHNFQQSLGIDHDGACATVRSELVKCETIAGFATIAPQDQASCLCYNNIGNYVPSIWDNAASSCWASGSSAHPFLYSLLTASSSEALGFCTKFAGPNAASATTTGPGTGSVTAVATVTSSTAAAASTTTSFSTATSSESTSSSSATATATTSSSSATQKVPVDKKLLAFGLFLTVPGFLMAIM